MPRLLFILLLACVALPFAGCGGNAGGPTDTPMVTAENGYDRSILLRPDEVVPPIRWLCSPEGGAVTGRRFIGSLWDPASPPREAAQRAGGPIGWPGVGPAAIWPDPPGAS